MPADYVGYKVTDLKKESTHISLTLVREIPSGFHNDIKDVSVQITFLSDHSLRIKLIDPSKKRWEVPFPALDIPKSGKTAAALYSVDVTPNGKLTVDRKSNNRTIFSTDLTHLIYSDQFIQLKSSLHSNRVYGLGEHKSPLLKSTDWKLFTFFNHDKAGTPENYGLYGSHPFHLNVEDSNGTSNGVLLFNSNAMDILLQPQPAITYRTIGGVLDLFVFLGPKSEEVIQEYVSLIGKPSMPPFWGLGYQQCRCCPAPHTLAEQMVITNRTINAGIPFDVQWSAKEYMVNANDFTINNKTFGGFGNWVQHLHAIGMHYVPIIDPGIDPTLPAGTYPPFDDGLKSDIFIKNATNQLLRAKVWNRNGECVFPDFSNPKAREYWTKHLKEFHEKVAIDGLWNDMNEVANFIDGSKSGCPKNSSLEHPQYLPGNRSLIDKTICMTAKHHVGEEYNVHNMYALYQALVTDQALQDIRKKRSFVISRATFVGQGKYSGHWDGDVATNYDQMAWTIPSIMNFNMFGIPLVGGDICGFLGEGKNDTHFHELCSRWLEIGAFYPFSRNHNSKGVDQDPAALGQTVVKAAKNALEMRYSLLPYLYTQFYWAGSKGATVVRPLFFEFPKDSNSYGPHSETQFMWGSDFMIIPVTQAGKTQVNAYFPSGRWYPYSVEIDNKPIESKGQFMNLSAPIDKINTAIRGGAVLAILPPKQTTTAMRKENFTLLVALNNEKTADGHLYWDDGDSVDPIQSGQYSLISFKSLDNQLITEVVHHKYNGNVISDKVVVIGLKPSPKSVTINGNNHEFKYEESIEKLTISKLSLNLVGSKNTITWK